MFRASGHGAFAGELRSVQTQVCCPRRPRDPVTVLSVTVLVAQVNPHRSSAQFGHRPLQVTHVTLSPKCRSRHSRASMKVGNSHLLQNLPGPQLVRKT